MNPLQLAVIWAGILFGLSGVVLILLELRR